MPYKTIALFAKPEQPKTLSTFKSIIEFFQAKKIQLYFPDYLPLKQNEYCHAIPCDELAKTADLMIVVGGDGTMLQASHLVVDYGTPIIGINLGRLGFLNDIHPNELEEKLTLLLAGEFKLEERFLLEARVDQHSCYALNDIVLATGSMSHMIEYSIHIDNHLVCEDRSDGLIIATPTGSTAYALSGGGPILHPALNAIVIVPMFSHRLTTRPIVVPGDCTIKIEIFSKENEMKPRVCYDGLPFVNISAKQILEIKKKKKTLHLLHPPEYDYYANVRSKLAWGK